MTPIDQWQHGADAALLILRLGVAPTFLYHGIEKRKYWAMKPGGPNSGAMLKVYRFLSVAEPLGGAALLTGFLTRYAALGICLIMAGAIRTRIVAWKESFGDDGWELDWILLTSAAAMVLLGGGSFGIDGLLRR